MGGIFATWTAQHLRNALPSALIVPLIFAAGFIGGALWGIIPAILKIKYAINEVITTLMLNYICAEFLTMLIVGPWKGKTRFGFPGTDALPDAAILGVLPGSRIHYATLILAIVLAIAAWFFMELTRMGIQIRSTGENPKATESQGVNVSLIRYACVLVGGVFSALAGAHLSISYSSSWVEGMTAGRGWIAIALTIFALWNPGRAIFASFLFGGIFVLQYLLQPLGISPNFLAMLPYLCTLIILLAISFKNPRRLNAPAWLGAAYKRGER
ncbi:putative ABC-type transport system, permease component [Desulfobacter postgatei 2ac9]|uniref:Putative ABC-type transport system, permease component n=2 Tax=Desulfobacter postgatei TaxID=2293 RepID=I5B392_9BACT|nr:ABC transporter permease [Desulfobacter postgatei]EIM63955.1 putative ABC-type transport system, permease component [Desulfobacter postgatei 2ac9]